MDNLKQNLRILEILAWFDSLAKPQEKNFLSLIANLRKLEKIKDEAFNKIISQKIPSHLFSDEAFVLKAIYHHPRMISFLSDSLKNDKIYAKAIKIDFKCFYYMPDEFKTYDLCLQMAQTGEISLAKIPTYHRTLEVCLSALEHETFLSDLSLSGYKHVKIVPNPNRETTLMNLRVLANKGLVKKTIGEIQNV